MTSAVAPPDLQTITDNCSVPRRALPLRLFISGRLRLRQVFDLERESEPGRFKPATDALGDHRMLWHGTDVATAAAICATGLRIMPNSGGRVGKGIYLADEANKSGYYVNPTASGAPLLLPPPQPPPLRRE